VLAAALAVALGPAALATAAGLVCLAVLVRYPPALLVVYVYIGVFKGQGILGDVPLDVTAALGVVLALVCLSRLAQGRARPVPAGYLGLLLLIAVMLAVSLTWTPMADYGAEKVFKFFTFTALAAVAPFFIIEDRRDLRHLLLATVGLAALGALVSLTDPGAAESGRLEFGGNENTIFMSRLLCAGALVLLVAPALGVPRPLRLVAPLLGVGLVIVAAGIGSRGPIVSLGLALACVIAASAVTSPRQLLSVLLIVAVGIAIFPLIDLPETSRQRLEQTVQDPALTFETDGRSRLYGKAIELTEEHPVFGFGSGGFFLFSYVLIEQRERYPHNMFLELSSEVGLAPAIALAVAVLYVLLAVGRRALAAGGSADRRLIVVVGALFLMNLFAVQFSGDINDNRVFWAMFGVAWLLARYGVPHAESGRRLALVRPVRT
jgi:O-antigen ligase